MTDLVESRNPLSRDVAESPAVERQEVDLRRQALRLMAMVDDNGRRLRDMLGVVTGHDHGAGGVCGGNGD
jgi:hypothetical protein